MNVLLLLSHSLLEFQYMIKIYIVDEECDLSVRAGVFMERLKAYEPELPKDMEPMVYVNYCEKSELGNPRCQKLSDLDSKTVEQDKAWYGGADAFLDLN